jgi:type III restriction enzyme
MTRFFEAPILNSPYHYPDRHWELDESGKPTQSIKEGRRWVSFLTAIPASRKQVGAGIDQDLFDEQRDANGQNYQSSIIGGVREAVDKWRLIPDPSKWNVTPETARLLQHWRNHSFSNVRPFFCQVEAAETAIWLTEVAPQIGKEGERFLSHLRNSNAAANPEIFRLALKLATGAGKTTVMAMLIAWQTVNAIRHPAGKKFTRGFLIVTPGITIKDRLRVLYPNDADSYYASRELVPPDMLPDIARAKIVITNYHAFKLRETWEVAAGTKALLKGRGGDDIQTRESEGQMIARVLPELMGLKNVLVINDEAHHCYREKAKIESAEDAALKGDEKKEAEKNNEAARLWISGIEAIKRKIGVTQVIDLSATPFFLRGSGYREGTLFPWTMSDFSLMDAIESGIVKLPRVPVTDNLPLQPDSLPMYRDLWTHIGNKMPKKGRGKGGELDPQDLPLPLQTALEALYGHYAKTFDAWASAGIDAPPCYIVVCNNTAASKLVYDYIAGYERTDAKGVITTYPGKLEYFRNYDEHGNLLARPRTLLIDSEQLESGESLDDTFRKSAAVEIERFRREMIERTGSAESAADISDQEILREVMNTVGRRGRLGESIRCVVSVSMLTEGWDTNTVTHVLGVRAFGTQLLCEQVMGRALRRQSYELNAEGKFDVEYADILGIPFDFASEPTVAPVQKPRETIHVRALNPERQHLEIRWPRVEGYRRANPSTRLEATFTDDHHYLLTPEKVGATQTVNAGIIGEAAELNLRHTREVRKSTVSFTLATYLLTHYYRDEDGQPKLSLFGDIQRIVRQWLETCLACKGDTYPAQVGYKVIADEVCTLIQAAIFESAGEQARVFVTLDPFNPTGSTRNVGFSTTKTTRYETLGPPPKCHVNFVITDSSWEAEFCRVAERHPKVIAYVKNHNLGFEVPYLVGAQPHRYRPDFIVRVDDGRRSDDPLNLIVEIKGRQGYDVKAKKLAVETYWLPGVNALGTYGRWAFAQFEDVFAMQTDFEKIVSAQFEAMIQQQNLA